MPERPSSHTHPWRRPLLAAEFIALAILIASMALLGQSGDGQFHTGWLLVPAIASLVVFLSFLGLMYLRWVVATEGRRSRWHKLLFSLLALTMLSVWAFAIAQTWQSLPG